MLKEALRLLWLESATTVPSLDSNLWAARGAESFGRTRSPDSRLLPDD